MFTITVRLLGNWLNRRRIRALLKEACSEQGCFVFYTEAWGLFSSTFIITGTPTGVQSIITRYHKECA